MRQNTLFATLSTVSSMLFLSLFAYIGWEALQAVFGSKTKAVIAILILLLEGAMILWLRFMCSRFVDCRKFVDWMTALFLMIIVLLCLIDATLLLIDREALKSDFYGAVNAVLFAGLLIIGFLLAWESINVTINWIRGENSPELPSDTDISEQKYGKAGYH